MRRQDRPPSPYLSYPGCSIQLNTSEHKRQLSRLQCEMSHVICSAVSRLVLDVCRLSKSRSLRQRMWHGLWCCCQMSMQWSPAQSALSRAVCLTSRSASLSRSCVLLNIESMIHHVNKFQHIQLCSVNNHSVHHSSCQHCAPGNCSLHPMRMQTSHVALFVTS